MPTYSLQTTRASSQYARNTSVTGLPNLNVANTISLWVMPLATAGSVQYQILYSNAAGRYIGLRLNANGTIDLIWNMGASESWPSSGTAPMSVNKWHHIAMVRTSSTASAFYIDGKQVATSGNTATSTSTTLAIIGGADTVSDFATARISDVRHFSTGLSAAQLLEAAYGDTVTGATEVHRWLLDNDYTDSVGSDNLTATNSPTFATNIPFTRPTEVDGSSLDNSLRAYYSFDEASGDAADENGNTYPLTNNGGVSYVTGKLGNASHFENTYPSNNDSFSRSGLGADMTAATISFWYKSSVVTNLSDSGITSVGNWSGSGMWAIIARGNGTISVPRFEFYGVTPDEATIGTVNIADGSWHHVVMTMNNSTDQVVIYVDGKRDTYKQYTTMIALDLTSINFYVGTYLVSTYYRGLVNGDVDELYIAAFEADYGDVVDLYNEGSGLEWSGAINVEVTPTTLSCTFSIPTYTATPVRNVTPAATTLSATFSIPAYTVTPTIGITVNATTLAATFSIPTYVVEAGNVNATPPTLTATFTLIAPTVTAEIYIEVVATTLSATFSIPSYVVGIYAGDSPETLSATFTIPTYTVEVISNIEVTPTVLSATFSLPTYVVGLSVDFSPATQTATFSIIAPTVVAARSVEVAAVVFTATFSLPTLAFFGGAWKVQAQVTDEWTPTSITE